MVLPGQELAIRLERRRLAHRQCVRGYVESTSGARASNHPLPQPFHPHEWGGASAETGPTVCTSFLTLASVESAWNSTLSPWR